MSPQVCALEEKVNHYSELFSFLLLLALFCTVLWLQADSRRTYSIISAHEVLLPPVSACGRQQ